MAFLNSVRPHLRDQSEIHLRIKREGETLAITVIPRLEGLDPDTDDAALAAFQAALCRPFHLTVAANDDPDAVLASVLTEIGRAQSSTQEELSRYVEQVENERKTAREAAEKKRADEKSKLDAKKKVSTPPKKPAVTKAATPTEPANAPEPVAAHDLFSTPENSAATGPSTKESTDSAPGVAVEEPCHD
jgi:PRTRC genetic system protein E